MPLHKDIHDRLVADPTASATPYRRKRTITPAHRRPAALTAALVGAVAVGGCVAGPPDDVAPGPTVVTHEVLAVDAGPAAAARVGRVDWLRAQLHHGETLTDIRAYYPTAGMEVPPPCLAAGGAPQHTGIPRAEMADELDALDLDRFDRATGPVQARGGRPWDGEVTG